MKMTLSAPSSSNGDKCTSDRKSSSPSASPRTSPQLNTRHVELHSKSDSTLQLAHRRDSSPFYSQQNDSSPSSLPGADNVSMGDSNNGSASSASRSAGDFDGNRKDKKLSKRKSWFNPFYPTYKTRLEEFKKLFKDVQDDDRLIVDYSCALQKDILMQGRLYVSQNHLCFYANIFGWETNVQLKWKDVTNITKEKTALVIPNAIVIVTKNDRYFFTTFNTRDKTYLMMFRAWQNALMNQPLTNQEMWQWVRECYGDELGLTSEEEDGNSSLMHPIDDLEVSNTSANTDNGTEFMMGEDNCAVHLGATPIITLDLPDRQDDASDMESQSPTNQLLTSKGGSEEEQQPNLMDREHNEPDKRNLDPASGSSGQCSVSTVETLPQTPPSPSIPSHSPALPCYECNSKNHEGRHLISETVPVHIDQLFTLLFTSSKFYLDFHASRKTTDLTQTPWTTNLSDGCKRRLVHLTAALKQTIGPKTAQITEHQLMLDCSRAGNLYSIDVNSEHSGIPYAESFYVVFHYCLVRLSEKLTSLDVFVQIKYRKSVWGLVKGIIEKNCWSGLEDFFQSLSKSLREECGHIDDDDEDDDDEEDEELYDGEFKDRDMLMHEENALGATASNGTNSLDGSCHTPKLRRTKRKRRNLLLKSIQGIGGERKQSTITQAPLIPSGSADFVRQGVHLVRQPHSFGLLILIAVLTILAVINVTLYCKLWWLETDFSGPMPLPHDISSKKQLDKLLSEQPPVTHNDWVHLLRRQDQAHQMRLDTWQKIVNSAIGQLKQVEKSLNELQNAIDTEYSISPAQEPDKLRSSSTNENHKRSSHSDL